MKRPIQLSDHFTYRKLLQFVFPSVVMMIFTSIYGVVDGLFVSNYAGKTAFAAINLVMPFIMVLGGIGFMIGTGGTALVSKILGEGDQEKAKRYFSMMILFTVLVGAVLTAVGVAYSPTFLRWMDTPENVLPLSSVYMRIYFGGITFTMVYNYCTSILRAAGDTQSPMIILMGAGVLNVILNVVFVSAFDMNVAGVAWATVISQALSAGAVTLVLMRRKDACRFCPAKMRIYGPQLKKIVRIGLPAGIQGATFSISNVIIQSSMNSFGETMVSGNAAVSNLEGFCYNTVNGFHQAAVNYIGQNVGAHQFERVKKVFSLCVLYATLAGLLTGGLLTIFRRPLLSIYITDSPEALAIGMKRVFFTAMPYFLFGLLDSAGGALRGMGASTLSMIISVVGICGSRLLWIFTVFQIPELHTPECLYSSYPISWVLTLIAEMIAFPIVHKKMVCSAGDTAAA